MRALTLATALVLTLGTGLAAQPAAAPGFIVGIDVIFINLKNTPLDKPKVRQALALTIDPEKIGRSISALLTEQRPVAAAGLLFPGSPGFDRSRQFVRNIERARTLIKESAIEDPSSLRPLIMYVSRARTEWRGVTADIAADGFRALGFTVIVQEVGDIAIVGAVARRGQGDFFLFAPVNVRPNTTAQQFYRDFLQNTLAPDGGANFFGYRNRQLDDLLSQYAVAQGPAVGDILGKIEQILIEDVPFLPVLFRFYK